MALCLIRRCQHVRREGTGRQEDEGMKAKEQRKRKDFETSTPENVKPPLAHRRRRRVGTEKIAAERLGGEGKELGCRELCDWHIQMWLEAELQHRESPAELMAVVGPGMDSSGSLDTGIRQAHLQQDGGSVCQQRSGLEGRELGYKSVRSEVYQNIQGNWNECQA